MALVTSKFAAVRVVWVCHKQFLRLEKAHRDVSIDDIVSI